MQEMYRVEDIEEQIEVFIDWFAQLPYTYKIFIAGNHDFFFERGGEEQIKALDPRSYHLYLNDSGVTVEGILRFAVIDPVQPWFLNCAI